MSDAYTASARRALQRALVRAMERGAAAVEPADLLAALVDEEESRAAALLAEFGLSPAQVFQALNTSALALSEDELDSRALDPILSTLPHSAEVRSALGDAALQARALDRGRLVGTEHLLAGLIGGIGPVAELLATTGLEPSQLNERLASALEVDTAPIPVPTELAPADLGEPVDIGDLWRILDASANRAREGLRVVEDYVRFTLEDPGLTRRLKDVRHRLAEAMKGFDSEQLLAARDTPGDVGTHIMTASEQTRENPRAVLTANLKRAGEALRTLEEYSKLVDVWLSGRFEVLRYDVYTLEKLVLNAAAGVRAMGDARLMLLVGGLPTLGDLTWVVGEALAGGADVIQLREKDLPDREWLRRAREVRILTAQAKARFVVNDRPDLARLAGADAVHLGQDDLSVRDTRRVVGPKMTIGVSTHDRSQLEAAVLAGAGYLGVGPVFPSQTKTFSEDDLAGLAYVRDAAEATSLPWFAIGGIDEENIYDAIQAGAKRVAVSRSIVAAPSPREAASVLRAYLDNAWSAD